MTAEYRSVQTRMWREDDWFQNQPTDARLLFIYLFTNPSASVSGIYRLPLRTIVFESGLSAERVNELLTQFSRENKAHVENGVVWVVKMRDNQLPGRTLSDKIVKHLEGEIAKIPPCRLKNMYLQAYGYYHRYDTCNGYGYCFCAYRRTHTQAPKDTEAACICSSRYVRGNLRNLRTRPQAKAGDGSKDGAITTCSRLHAGTGARLQAVVVG